MPDHAHGGPYAHPHGDEPDEVTAQRRRAVESEIKALEASVAEQERRMLDVARRHADELERDPGQLDQKIDDLYREAGMRRPPQAAASMVLSEARYDGTVYPMGPERRPAPAMFADLAQQSPGEKVEAFAAEMEARLQ